MNDAIRQRALAVVDVGDDGEIADVVHGLNLGLERPKLQRRSRCMEGSYREAM
ncbi:hypothetical protein PEC18_21425 [Paucibacter sp. O1-1]|nr:hypothetical protein [Paucibacter sp. O1-1]MDA3828311.1 hypothetical protein [Paucibacter sp. O1-1]